MVPVGEGLHLRDATDGAIRRKQLFLSSEHGGSGSRVLRLPSRAQTTSSSSPPAQPIDRSCLLLPDSASRLASEVSGRACDRGMSASRFPVLDSGSPPESHLLRLLHALRLLSSCPFDCFLASRSLFPHASSPLASPPDAPFGLTALSFDDLIESGSAIKGNQGESSASAVEGR